MHIALKNIGKRYQYNWVLRELNFEFEFGKIYGISGPNGSGKSTLLKVISGFLTPTTGHVEYSRPEGKISRDDVFRFFTYVAPYIDIIDEFTLKEAVKFHFNFKKCRLADTDEVIKTMELSKVKDRQLSDFSSGMSQRVKLGLALFTEVPVLLLDEPTSNLDTNAKSWFYGLLERYQNQFLTIIASNEAEELSVASEILKLE